ncbi:ATP-binding protein [Tenacibaculum geojense]|uniref:histidine kinase n=1 Tax=Tenacibaculum geojense TaxID=915352 RepID=A0ABW3JTZ4_9FLAO
MLHTGFKKQLLSLLLLFSVQLSFSQKKTDSLLTIALDKGYTAYFNRHPKLLANEINNIKSLYNTSKDSTTLAYYYQYKAMLSKLHFKNDSAFYYYNESKIISEKIKDSLAAGRRLLSIGILQHKLNDHIGGEITLIEALKFLEPIQSNKYLERVYNSLGTIHNYLLNENEALMYYNLALEYNKKNNNPVGYLYLLNNIGLNYQKNNKNKEALTYFTRGLAFDSIKTKYPTQYTFLLENFAISTLKLNYNAKVLDYHLEVLSIREQLKDYYEISSSHLLITDYYILKSNTKKAIYHAQQSLEFAKKTHNNQRYLEALNKLSNLHTGEKSKNYLVEYINLNDSLIRQERNLKNRFAKIKYQTEKKEQENNLLKAENEQKQVQINYEKQQKTIGWLFAAISLLGLSLSASFFVIRRKQLVFNAQLQKEEAREHERQQIAKSLHDEVAGDLRLLHLKLQKSALHTEAAKLESVKENVRNLSHQLSSVSFDKVSFKDQIINLISDYFELDFKIKVTGLKEIDWSLVNNSIKRLLFLSIRESIQNCKKHANATKVNIHFTHNKKNVFLEITDNGKGFDTQTQKKGIGLHNIQSRVEELKGSFVIESEIGSGTQTRIQIPLNG